jgi:hypothetical protein
VAPDAKDKVVEENIRVSCTEERHTSSGRNPLGSSESGNCACHKPASCQCGILYLQPKGHLCPGLIATDTEVPNQWEKGKFGQMTEACTALTGAGILCTQGSQR